MARKVYVNQQHVNQVNVVRHNRKNVYMIIHVLNQRTIVMMIKSVSTGGRCIIKENKCKTVTGKQIAENPKNCKKDEYCKKNHNKLM